MSTILTRFAAAALMAVLYATTARAATTEWMSEAGLNSYIKTNWGGAIHGTPPKFYPTAIECRDARPDPQFRMTYSKLTGQKPFYRWSWVFDRSSGIQQAVTQHKISDRPELKYRIVQQGSYTAGNGVKMSCAIIYR